MRNSEGTGHWHTYDLHEHFLTDYGDEAAHTLPGDLFTRESAEEASMAARRSPMFAWEVLDAIESCKEKQQSDK